MPYNTRSSTKRKAGDASPKNEVATLEIDEAITVAESSATTNNDIAVIADLAAKDGEGFAKELETVLDKFDGLGEGLCGLAVSVDVVFDAMKNHPDELIVQEASCVLLRLSMLGHRTVGGPRAKQQAEYIVHQLNGVELVISAMTNFSNEATTVRTACAVLKFLTNWDEFNFTIKKCGGLSVLAKALENHGNDKATSIMASGALKNLLCEGF